MRAKLTPCKQKCPRSHHLNNACASVGDTSSLRASCKKIRCSLLSGTERGMGLFDYPMEASAAAASGPVAEAFVFLGALPGDAWEKILAIVETRHFRRGDNIITRGERDDSFYILSSGAVSVVVPDKRGRDSVIAEIPEGSVFGEIAFFDREPRSATIRAQTDGSAI